MKKIKKRMIVCFMGISSMFYSCNSDLNDNIKDDPYGGGKAPLGVGLLTEAPSPSSAYPNDTVIFKAKGLLNWCDPQVRHYDFEFFISDEKTEIITATDTTLTIKVPENLSSGISHIVLKDQVFYGPRLTVLGNIRIDRQYKFKGTSGPVYDCVEHYSKAQVFYPVGDYQYAYYNETSSQRFSCISMVLTDGSVSGKWATDFKLDPGQGAGIDISNPSITDRECYINSFAYFPSDNRVLLSGIFTQYGYGEVPANNITIATNEVASYYTSVTLPSIRNAAGVSCKIPVFNGGTLEAPVRTFITSDEKVVAAGNITNYCRINIDKSYAEAMVLDYEKVASVLRMERTGDLDTLYRKDAAGVIGQIKDACMDENDGVVIVGSFNSFDGQTVHNIVKLKADGTLDETFLSNTGTGANGAINKIRYNKNKGKALLIGEFSVFNGIPSQGAVMLNVDGTRDEDFNIGRMEGGMPNFACLLNNDKIVLSGTFTKYDGVTRRGFLMLDRDGKAMQRFNVPGTFMGELYRVIESRTSTNSNGLLLLGDFSRFDGEKVRNAVMIEIDYE
jgi:hypothetical protein